MLRVLLWVVQQKLDRLHILLVVARPFRRSRDGIDADLPAADLAVGLGRGAEDAESPEIEIEEVGRGVDGTQGTINFEVIAREGLNETTGEHNLEDIATQAVLHTATHILPVLLIGDGAPLLTLGEEVVGGEVALVDQRLHLHHAAHLLLAL